LHKDELLPLGDEYAGERRRRDNGLTRERKEGPGVVLYKRVKTNARDLRVLVSTVKLLIKRKVLECLITCHQI